MTDGAASGRIPFVELSLNTGPNSAVQIPLLDARNDAAATQFVSNGTTISGPRLFLMSLVHSMQNTESGGNSLTLTVLDPNWDYLSTLLAGTYASQERVFSVRYGWRHVKHLSTPSLVVEQSRTASFFVVDIGMELTPFRGAQVVIHGRDQTVTMMETQVSRAFAPTETISNVITQLITDYGMIPVVADIPIPVGDSCRMENITAHAYITELLKLARTAEGASNFQIYSYADVSGKTTVYVQPAFGSTPSGKAKALYVLGRDRTGEMLSFAPNMNNKLLLAFGGGRVTATYVDPITKKAERVTSTQSEDKCTAPYRAIKTPTQPSLVVESPYDLAVAQAQGAAYRQTADSMQYAGSSVVVGNTKLLPRDYIDIVVMKGGASFEAVKSLSASDIHLFSSGRWQLWGVSHQIDSSSGFQTHLDLRRMSGFVGAGQAGLQVDMKFAPPPSAQEESDLVAVQPVENPDADWLGSALDAASGILGSIGG